MIFNAVTINEEDMDNFKLLEKKVSIITKSERRFNINSILLSISRIEDLSDNVKCVRIPFNDSVNY